MNGSEHFLIPKPTWLLCQPCVQKHAVIVPHNATVNKLNRNNSIEDSTAPRLKNIDVIVFGVVERLSCNDKPIFSFF